MYDTPDILRCYTDRAIDDVLCEYIGIQQREFAYKPVRKMRVGQDAIAIKRHITKSETQPEVQADDGVTAKKIQNVYVYCQYITRISLPALFPLPVILQRAASDTCGTERLVR